MAWVTLTSGLCQCTFAVWHAPNRFGGSSSAASSVEMIVTAGRGSVQPFAVRLTTFYEDELQGSNSATWRYGDSW